MKNVLLIYGQPLSQRAIKALFNADHALKIDDETSSINDALSKLRQRRFDAVILDISAAQSNGLETFCDLKQACRDLPILITNGSPHTERMLHFTRLGCAGYLAYTCDSDHVLPAMQAILRGQQYIIPLAKAQASHHALLHERLTLRELQVFFKLVKGQTINAVANELHIAPGSVSVLRAKILKKMNAHNNAALIRYAMTHALVSVREEPL